MSTTDPADEAANTTNTTGAPPPPSEPLSPLESHLAEAEAIRRAPQTSDAADEARRHGRVEAETHRISEDVTHEAQRRRQAQLAVPPPTIEATASEATTIVDVTTARLPESLTFKRILVPLDGSERAERAIALAARIAQAGHGSVLLAQVVRPPVACEGPFMPVEASMEASLEAAEIYLKSVAHREELADVEVHRKALTGLSAATALLEAVMLYQCDLVILCSHGRSGLVRWALGSVAQKIVQQAAAPVLVLRPEGVLPPVARPSGKPTVRALVTLDGSDVAETALLPAARLVGALAGPGHGALHLLRVLDRSYPGASKAPVLPYRDPDEAAIEEARTYLYTVAQRFERGELATLGLQLSWSTRDDLDVALGILDEAEADAAAGLTEADPYDLIAMATHGHSGFRLWALGSITDRVLQTTGLPLLVVPPR